MSALAPIIPLELQYLVIDVYIGSNSLFHTAKIRSYDLPLRLVCSSWHDYTSQLFFRPFKHIVLRDTDHAVRFCALVRASPRAAILVQTLSVDKTLSVTAGLAELLSEDMQQRLPNLRFLKLQHMRFAAIPRDKRMGNWAQVEQVHLNGRLVLETVDGLWDWVALFAGCGSLSFGGHIRNTPIPKEVAPPSDPPCVHLRSLVFNASGTIEPVIPAALASPNLRVDQLTLYIYDPSCYTPLLRVLPSKLQELWLLRHSHYVAIPLKLSDGSCPELHSATFSLLKPNARLMALVLSDVRVILRASPNLSQIKFRLPPVAADQVTLITQAWGGLDSLLAGTVGDVTFCITKPPGCADDPGQLGLLRALQACMPQLADLGALNFWSIEEVSYFDMWTT